MRVICYIYSIVNRKIRRKTCIFLIGIYYSTSFRQMFFIFLIKFVEKRTVVLYDAVMWGNR